ERGGPLGDLLHPVLLPGRSDVVGAAALHERRLQPVQRRIDGCWVVPAAGQLESNGAHVPRVHLRAAVLVSAAGVVEELLDLLPVIPTAPALDCGEQVCHPPSSSRSVRLCCVRLLCRGHSRYSWAASCPHAPSMSLPRVSRTVVGMPAERKRATNSASTSFSLAVQIDPGVGFSGIGFTCTQPVPHSSSSAASRSARQAWSFMSLIRAYSMLTRRPVASK